MGIITTLLVGLVVGALAKFLMPGRDPGGFIITMVLGILGAMTAGFIGKGLGMYRDANSAPGIIASVLGAMLLLFIYRMVISRRTRTS